MNHWWQVTSKDALTRRAGLSAVLCLTCATSYGAANVEVYVAYAENVHTTPVFMPNPWYGNPNVTFLGYPSSPPAASAPLAWNTGGILIRNAGATPVVLGPGVRVDGFTNPATSFTLWDSTGNTGDGLLGSSGIPSSGLPLAPGQEVILAQTGASRSSSTDFNPSPCTPATPNPLCSSNFNTSAIPGYPVIHLTLNGVPETFTDSAQILNTAGINSATNQSVQWRLIGTTGPALPGGSGVNPPPVATWHNDNLRTGLNALETTLNVQNVNCMSKSMPCNFGQLFSYQVDSAVRGQPLFVPGVLINGPLHNTVFVVTTNNTVYAFDAESAVPVTNGKPLWTHALGTPPAMGSFPVYSTPVIDTTTSTLYVVTNTKANFATLHALDLSSGSEKFNSPTNIGGAVLGIGDDALGYNAATKTITFNVDNSTNCVNAGVSVTCKSFMMQRPALLLYNGSVYIAFGSDGDTPPFHGWLFGYDAGNIAQATQIFNTTPMATSTWDASYHASWHVAGGAFWMAGAGPAADGTGIFATTGNGEFDASYNFGDSIIRLIPPAPRSFPLPYWMPPLPPMVVADYFTPFDQQCLARTDSDLGSSGPLLLPPPNPPLLVQASKSGRIYLLNRTAMGRYHSSCSSPGGPPCEPIVQVIDQAIGVPAAGTPAQDSPAWCPAPVAFTAYISGTQMTVTAMSSGALTQNQTVFGPGVLPNTVITGVGAAGGGIGTYTVSVPQTVDSSAAPVSMVGSLDLVGSQATLGTPAWKGVLKGSPAYFNGSVYFKADNDYLKAFQLMNGQFASAPPIESTNQTASYANPSISYDSNTPNSQNSTGIVWTVENDSDQAVLYAYQATPSASVPANLQLLYKATVGPLTSFPAPATVAAGKVFVGTQNQLVAYGALPSAGEQTDTLKVKLTVSNGSKFDIFIDGVLQLQGAPSGALIGPLQLTLGTHTVSASLSAAAYGVPNSYSISYQQSCAADGTVNLQSGSPAYCTIVAQDVSCSSGTYWNPQTRQCASVCPASCVDGCYLPQLTPSGPVWVCKGGCPPGFTSCGLGVRGRPECVKPPEVCQ